MDFFKILQLPSNLVRLALNDDADLLWLHVTVNANYLVSREGYNVHGGASIETDKRPRDGKRQ